MDSSPEFRCAGGGQPRRLEFWRLPESRCRRSSSRKNRIPSSVGSDVASENGKESGAEYPKEEEEVDYEEHWAESDERRHLARFWGLPGEEVERG